LLRLDMAAKFPAVASPKALTPEQILICGTGLPAG
jgi:hypothetical protein